LGGKFFPKDKAYLIGRQEVENVIKSSHESWLDVGKINWRILPEIFQFGIIPENIRHPYQNATKAVWERKLLARHKKQK